MNSCRLVTRACNRTVLRSLHCYGGTSYGSSLSTAQQQPLVAITQVHQPWASVRLMSDKATQGEEKVPSPPDAEAVAAEQTTEGEQATAAEQQPTLREQELAVEVKELRDQLLRSLAEQENTRRIAKRDVEEARNFAIKSFAKSLLDVSDNLTRALEAVPEDHKANKESHPVLANLYEGIQLTDQELTKAFERNGLVKYGRTGETFDPNLHEALYEYPDATKQPGTIGQVMKPGFLLNKRVLRPAEVGIIKKP